MHGTKSTLTTEQKRIASVTARLALAGIALLRAPDGTFVATRWSLTRVLPTLDSAEVFAAAAMDRIR